MSDYGKIDNLSRMMPHSGNRGATIHHTAVTGWFCPAKCLARRVASIRAAGVPDSTPLSYVSPGSHVVADHILKAVRAAAMQTGLGPWPSN
eukprot:scaffold168832_cov29-Attheya_sp.AAC.1